MATLLAEALSLPQPCCITTSRPPFIILHVNRGAAQHAVARCARAADGGWLPRACAQRGLALRAGGRATRLARVPASCTVLTRSKMFWMCCVRHSMIPHQRPLQSTLSTTHSRYTGSLYRGPCPVDYVVVTPFRILQGVPFMNTLHIVPIRSIKGTVTNFRWLAPCHMLHKPTLITASLAFCQLPPWFDFSLHLNPTRPHP